MIAGNRTPRVTLVGTFSRGDAGKLAVLSSTVKQFCELSGRPVFFEVCTDNPSYIRSELGSSLDVTPVNCSPLTGCMGYFGIPTFLSLKKSDLVVVLGEKFSKSPWYKPFDGRLVSLLLVTLFAKSCGKPVVLIETEADDCLNGLGKALIRKITELAELVVCSDEASRDNLHNLFLDKPVFCTASSAFASNNAGHDDGWRLLGKLGVTGDQAKPLLIIEIPGEEPGFNQQLAEAVLGLKQSRNIETVLVNFRESSYQQVRQFADTVSSCYAQSSDKSWRPAYLSSRDHLPEQLIAALGCADLVVGSSPEALVFGALSKTPVSVFSTSKQVESILAALGTRELSIDTQGMEVAALEDRLIEILDSAQLASKRQNNETALLVERSFEAVELVVERFFSPAGQTSGQERVQPAALVKNA